MTYKVIQWSTGNVGRHAVRLIAHHPELELAGLWVHGTDKVGRDAGELVGIERLGVTLEADCVCYTATADLRPGEAIADLTRIAQSGKHIVSSSVVPLVYPPHVPDGMRGPLEQACLDARVSCFTSGIDPGWANDLLPIALTGQCESIEHIRMMEIVNYATYAQPTVLFDTMGFGAPLDHTPLLLVPGVLTFAWGGVVKQVAAAVGAEITEIKETVEKLPATRDLDLGFGVVHEGTMGALRFEVQGYVDGVERVVLEHVTRLADDLAPAWPQPVGHSGYRVVVSGSPNYTLDLQMMGADGDHNTAGLVGTAARLVNAIPAVCNARPGLVSAMDLPLVSGRGLLQH
jgi:4-hydroxy-tetrahydrodipicolinate reductase